MHGTYPYVTSSPTIAGGATIGAGVGPCMIDAVVGIAKAYCTRVGEGPFPTEMVDATGDEVRARGHEFGTITGRPRRCGWFDAVALRRAVRVSGIQSLIITKLDVLSGLRRLKVCVGYRKGNESLDDLPALAHEFEGIEPEYVEYDGWDDDLSQIRRWEELPSSLQKFIKEIERLVECPVSLVSVGPGREATIPVDISPVLGSFFFEQAPKIQRIVPYSRGRGI